jgi:hypothetical protein
MTKKLAQGLMAVYNLWAVNHLASCACGKTAAGAAIVHGGKTSEEFDEILALASS